MSEEGWHSFLAADGVEDWVVLHGGPVAAFRTGSLSESAKLAAAVAEVDGIASSNVALTATRKWLTVRLTRELWGIDERHIRIAREVSAIARAHGATAERSAVQEVQFAVAAKPESIDVGFWRAVLGYDKMSPDNGIDPLAHSSTVWMQDIEPEKELRHAMHIDVSVSKEQAQVRLDAALAAGGKIVYSDAAPGTWILSDKSGNRVCIASWPDRGEAG